MPLHGKCTGGNSIGAYGMIQEPASRVHRVIAEEYSDIIDCDGVGGTLAGNALSLAAMGAVLGIVLTSAVFNRMES